MNAEADHQILESTDAPAPGVGARLRAAREARGITVGDVAHSLKLNPRQVAALETDRYDLLPGPAFARGFLKNYARFLDLDPVPLLEAVDQAAGGGAMELAPVSNARGIMPSGEARLRPSVFPAALVALLLMVLVGAGWYFDWFQQPPLVVEEPVAAPATEALAQPANVAPLPAPPLAEPAPAAPALAVNPVMADSAVLTAPFAGAAGAPVPSSAAPTQAPAAPAQPPASEAAEAPKGDLVFRFAEDAWVEVRDGAGRVILSRTGKAGSTEALQGNPPFALVIGNAAKVRLEFRGEPVDLTAHTRVSVARLKLE